MYSSKGFNVPDSMVIFLLYAKAISFFLVFFCYPASASWITHVLHFQCIHTYIFDQSHVAQFAKSQDGSHFFYNIPSRDKIVKDEKSFCLLQNMILSTTFLNICERGQQKRIHHSGDDDKSKDFPNFGK